MLLELTLIILVESLNQASQQTKSKAIPFNQYHRETSNGFTFFISPYVMKNKALAEEFRKVESEMTSGLIEKIPKDLVQKFQKVRIFVEIAATPDSSHPAHYNGVGNISQKDLRNAILADKDRVIIPEKARAVEITHVRRVIKDFRHPILLLHEFAHYFHDRQIGLDNIRIKRVYRQAKERGIYSADAYCMTNEMEYFAELTGVYFYPTYQGYFKSADEFKEKDPQGYKMIVDFYELNKKP